MSVLATTLAGSAALAAPAAAPGQVATAPQPAPARAAQASPWVTVTSAQDLVGRTLRDPQGHDAGRIHAVIVDVERGDAIYAVVGSDGSFDIGGDYVPVPFSALTLSPDKNVMNVAVSADKIAKSPRVSEARLAEFGQANGVGTVYGYYAVPMPHGYVVPPSGERSSHPDQLVLVQPGEIALLGRSTASNVRGETVKAENGDTIGEIDRVIIDPSDGRIAYLLLSRGGFLGIGGEWVPVPAQALTWSRQDNAFVLKGGLAQAAQNQHLQKGTVPFQVRRDQLQALYESYGVQPYWQQG